MRIAVTLAVLLAVVATALVAVCQHSETRRLQYRVWQLERRRESLERTRLRLLSATTAERTARRLLGDHDRRHGTTPAAPTNLRVPHVEAERGSGLEFRGPDGFRAGQNFESSDRGGAR